MSEFLGILYWMIPSWAAVGIFFVVAFVFKSPWRWLVLIPVTAVVTVNALFVYWLANFQM